MAQYPATIDLSTINGINGFKIDGAATNDFSGVSVAAAGDFNHDGYLDIVVGASGHDSNSFSNNGAAYVLFGSAAGFAANIDLGALNGTDGFEIDGITGGSGFGSSVSSAGDINGDGFSDLVIGAPTEFSTSSSTTPGATYVVFGHGGSISTLNVSALDGTNSFRIQGAHSLDRNGYSVSTAGDDNDDGISDIVIGAPQADPNGTSSGDAYVVFGRKTGFSASLA